MTASELSLCCNSANKYIKHGSRNKITIANDYGFSYHVPYQKRNRQNGYYDKNKNLT